MSWPAGPGSSTAGPAWASSGATPSRPTPPSGSATTAASTVSGSPDGGGRGTCAGGTRPTAASSGPSTGCAGRRARSASTTRRNGARRSSASSTRNGTLSLAADAAPGRGPIPALLPSVGPPTPTPGRPSGRLSATDERDAVAHSEHHALHAKVVANFVVERPDGPRIVARVV